MPLIAQAVAASRNQIQKSRENVVKPKQYLCKFCKSSLRKILRNIILKIIPDIISQKKYKKMNSTIAQYFKSVDDSFYSIIK